FSPEWFDEMGRRYLAHHPPQTWTLAELGASFPEFLESDRPDGGSEPEPAFDFIVDLARFERARTEVFRGPGIEHADLSSLDAIAEAETLDVIFTLAPSLRLLKLRFDVFTYYSQACQSDEARVPQFGEQHVVISRRNYQVQFREIAPWQFEFLQALSQDVTPRSAINHLRDHAEIDISDTTCHHWLRDCIRHGYFLPARNLEGQAVCMPPRENA
ncbi:MAG: putative DNA-binding domain-containing protein, partial [Planctomycetaceae bacterium]|nr:putative DNA-binding domain-containing protein [Planctomycetaceae bacterium]